jgi:hypothetical protein
MNQPQRMPGRFFKPGIDAQIAQRKAIKARRATDAWMREDVTGFLLRDRRLPDAMVAVILARIPVRRLWALLPS